MDESETDTLQQGASVIYNGQAHRLFLNENIVTKDLTQSLNAGDTQFANEIGYPLRLNKCQENI